MVAPTCLPGGTGTFPSRVGFSITVPEHERRGAHDDQRSMAYFAIALLGFALAFGATCLWRVGLLTGHTSAPPSAQMAVAAEPPSPEVVLVPAVPSFEPPAFSTNDALTATQVRPAERPSVATAPATTLPKTPVTATRIGKPERKPKATEIHRAAVKPVRVHHS